MLNTLKGFGDGEMVNHTREEAAAFFKALGEATNLPYIYLSVGVSAKLFQETPLSLPTNQVQLQWSSCGRATQQDQLEAHQRW